MKNLEVLAVGASANRDILLIGKVPHGEAAAWEQVVPNWRCLGVWDGERAKQVEGRCTDGHVFAIDAEQHILADAELDIAMSAQILRVVGSPLNPGAS